MGDREVYPSYDVPIDDIISLINERRYRYVMLQIPEGLKRGAPDLAEIMEERTEAVLWIDGEPCYGACDHAGEKASVLNMDCVIHLGHSNIPAMDDSHSVPVHFYPVRLVEDPSNLLDGISSLIDELNIDSVGLTTTVQHLSLIESVTDLLERKGLKVRTGNPGVREQFKAQVLGCSFHTAREIMDEVDGFFFLGTGRFHALGLYLSVRKPVWMIDPTEGRVSMIEQDELDIFLKKRYAAITKARDLISQGERTGIVLGYKPGQRRMNLASYLKDIMKERGAPTTLITMEHIDPMKIRSLGCRLVCSTACPRIAVDDSDRYLLEGITLLTPQELRIGLDLEEWENYTLDEEW